MKSRFEIITFARESLGLAPDVDVELISFEGRGSDRAYYRLLWGDGNSGILVHYLPTRLENTYYADIARFLVEIRIPVPEIFRHDPDSCFVLMKDLGDADLWSLRNEPWEVRKNLYQKTLKIVHALHSFPETQFPSKRVTLAEPFGQTLYQWERNYFKDNFVAVLCGIVIGSDDSARLETELSGLAERLSSHRRSLVHRDLQSQNVMIYREEPFLIDVQGMRFGSCFYDLGSLLCDPYVSFSADERDALLRFYYDISETALDWNRFQNMFWEASAQRLMQALGAYGFLGIAKGQKNYLLHVPAGIRNLCMAAENAGSLPVLRDLCLRCESTVHSKLQIQDSSLV
jgi:N-acetylmuramate 1-kinase